MTAVSPSEPHTVTQDWRDAAANALEREVCAIQNWLAHTDDLVELADKDNDDRGASELRQVAGLWRERRDGRVDRARELRMAK